MTAICSAMLAAIVEEKERKIKNDQVVHTDVLRREYTWLYHDHPIVKADLGTVTIDPCGWEHAPSTRGRINAALWHLAPPCAGFWYRAGVLILNGKPAGNPPYIFERRLWPV